MLGPARTSAAGYIIGIKSPKILLLDDCLSAALKPGDVIILDVGVN